jgi:hypothetical protein
MSVLDHHLEPGPARQPSRRLHVDDTAALDFASALAGRQRLERGVDDDRRAVRIWVRFDPGRGQG